MQHNFNTDYEAHKAAAALRQQIQSREGRDIGELPPVVDPERRARGEANLQVFLETYFPQTFSMAWSPVHLRVIEKLQTAVMEGGLFALALPRAFGKTSMTEHAGIWALCCGHRRFVVAIGANEEGANEILDSIKTELECNDLLLEDFPEVCYPIRKLDGIALRCKGQLYRGERTHITWTADELGLPIIPGSKASGAIIKCTGITGRIRGMKGVTAEGHSIRPDLVLIDDPQTDASAASPEQNRKLLRVLCGAILGLSGPGRKIAGVMPCTVIRPGDMADQVLDKSKHPEWNGERHKLLPDFPKNTELWNRYREIWADSLRMHGDLRDATAFYTDNREAMDAGATVSWPERYEPGEISAVQYAMNLYIRDKETFYAEYQNEPLPDIDEQVADKITVEQVWKKMNGRKRGEIPQPAEKLIMFIDVQKAMLPFVILAVADNFTAWIVDYGAFPDQRRRYFSQADANPTLEMQYRGLGIEGRTYKALLDLTNVYAEKVYTREDGLEMTPDLIMVDSGWGRTTNAVFQFAVESPHRKIILPSKGVGVNANQKPLTEYKRETGLKIGFNWHLKANPQKRAVRYMLIDTNFWKSFYRERLFTAAGDPGALTLFGNDEEQTRLIAEHLSSEISEPTSGRGRRVDVWQELPGRENHWLDCVVGAMAGASMLGCELSAGEVSANLINNARRKSRAAATPNNSSFTVRDFGS